jgi:AcrR family transcriptional regulator
MMADRPLRADARSNQERLLLVAGEAFAREGTQASLKAIAQKAGVGIGTLYRRFPTREALVEAVYRNEVAHLCAASPELLKTLPPEAALPAWMEKFIDFMATKQGMADVLRVVLLSEEDRLHTRDQLRTAIAALLDAGATAGTLRAGIDPNDVLMGLGGISLIAGEENQRELATRLIGLLLHGVATTAAQDGAVHPDGQATTGRHG